MKRTFALTLLLLMTPGIGCLYQPKTRKTPILGLARMTPAQREIVLTGKRIFEDYCAGCHGADGNGKGPAEKMLLTKPRDFTKGTYKFKLTPSGFLPRDEDLRRIISQGVSRTSMPSWDLIPEREKNALIQYLKTFSPRWLTEPAAAAIAIPGQPAALGTAASVLRGRAVYAQMQCAKCHGEKGRGDGPSAGDLTDSDGNRIKPFDFTIGLLKGGRTVEDIYRTFTTGLDGTPMPAYGDILPTDDRWHLISYVLYLMNRTKVTEQDLARVAETAQAASAQR